MPAFGIRLADRENRGDLGVAESGEELERDQLALAGLEAGEGGAQGEPPLGALGARLDRGAVEVGGLGDQLGLPAAPTQLVERRVAGDAEEPGARLAAARVEAVALAVGPLEGGRRHFLGRGPVAEHARHVGVDVVAVRPVELVEGQVGLARSFPCLCDRGLTHARTTAPPPIHHRGIFAPRKPARSRF